MSGKDEKPVPFVEKEAQVNITCPHCGSARWKQYHSYSSTTVVDLEDDYMDEGNPQWYYADDWVCEQCDRLPSEQICTILRDRY